MKIKPLFTKPTKNTETYNPMSTQNITNTVQHEANPLIDDINNFVFFKKPNYDVIFTTQDGAELRVYENGESQWVGGKY